MEEIRIEDIKKRIQSGKTVLGIELGSTRIKGVLLTEEGELIADGSHQWETGWKTGYGPIRWKQSGRECRSAMAILKQR